MVKINNIELEILNYNYWEHFKVAKELALTLPLNHQKRISIENEIRILQQKINQLKQTINNGH